MRAKESEFEPCQPAKTAVSKGSGFRVCVQERRVCVCARARVQSESQDIPIASVNSVPILPEKMDINFADLKKEAAATNEDIFQRAQKAYEDLAASPNTSSGAQDDNAHTEHYFANEQKKLDFGDPQEFVQRLSAGAKEAQVELDAKFAQKADDFEDFLRDVGKEAKQGISGLTTDFMNAERGFASPLAAFSDAPPPVAAPVPDQKPAPAPAAVPAAAAAVQEEDLLGSFGADKPQAPLQSFQATAPSSANFYDDDDDDFLGKPLAAAPVSANSKDSDTESPSVSYTPSPAKKPIVDALKEQDNEKFISSEDLLSDFKEERTATPPASISAPAPSAPVVAPVPVPIVKPSVPPPQVPVVAPVTTALVTDLDDDEDFKPSSVQVAPKAPEPKPEPPKPKEEPPKPKVVPAPSQSQPLQPKIVSVEEIFYKYGLGEIFAFQDALSPRRYHCVILINYVVPVVNRVLFAVCLLVLSLRPHLASHLALPTSSSSCSEPSFLR